MMPLAELRKPARFWLIVPPDEMEHAEPAALLGNFELRRRGIWLVEVVAR